MYPDFTSDEVRLCTQMGLESSGLTDDALLVAEANFEEELNSTQGSGADPEVVAVHAAKKKVLQKAKEKLKARTLVHQHEKGDADAAKLLRLS